MIDRYRPSAIPEVASVESPTPVTASRSTQATAVASRLGIFFFALEEAPNELSLI